MPDAGGVSTNSDGAFPRIPFAPKICWDLTTIGLVRLDSRHVRPLVSLVILEDLAEAIKSRGFCPAIIEEYPTWNASLMDVTVL